MKDIGKPNIFEVKIYNSEPVVLNAEDGVLLLHKV